MRKKTLDLFFLISVSSLSFAQQDESFYQKIHDIGQGYMESLKAGEIETFRNVKPPNETWNYEDLVVYKEAVISDIDNILFGEFIEPSTQRDGIYAYNFFAIKKVEIESYYFAAVISIDTSNKEFKVDRAYLFTCESGLKTWWKHVFGFYQSTVIKGIPTKFLWPKCPPPPFRD
jgi:hypothetical protein